MYNLAVILVHIIQCISKKIPHYLVTRVGIVLADFRRLHDCSTYTDFFHLCRYAICCVNAPLYGTCSMIFKNTNNLFEKQYHQYLFYVCHTFTIRVLIIDIIEGTVHLHLLLSHSINL